MAQIVKYPVGLQSFESLREDGFLYVDKTALIHRLVNTSKYVFLSRPRRFGKSLLLTTIKAYFEGRRDLFKGLAIDTLEHAWTVHPVFLIDMNIGNYSQEGALTSLLNFQLSQYESIYGRGEDETSPSERFAGLLKRACELTGQKTVVLIDEYEKPILHNIDNVEMQEMFRAELQAFYSVLKSSDNDIRFAMLTGVTKIGKLSIFSGLNNINDISLNPAYGTICGITHQEMLDNFDEGIRGLAAMEGLSVDQAVEELRREYDGYNFSRALEGVYNPFSLVSALSNQQLSHFWYSTGTTTLLVKLLQQHDYDLENLEGITVDADRLSDVDVAFNDVVPVIFQTGYLTIKGYDRELGEYVLGFPNREVADGFVKDLLPTYGRRDTSGEFSTGKFVRDLRGGDAEAFMRRLQSFFADVPYEIARVREVHFHNAMYLMCKLVGFYVNAEYRTSDGRIDLVLKTDRFIYVFECKIDRSAEEALAQIDEKGYMLPFAADGRKLFKIGINFSTERRRLDSYLIEAL